MQRRPEHTATTAALIAAATMLTFAQSARGQRAPSTCVGTAVEVRRAHTNVGWRGPLVDCRGRPTVEALAALSALASPRAAISLVRSAPRRNARSASDALQPRLIETLSAVATRWPGHTIEVASGYRHGRNPYAHSFHASSRAVDFRVIGVSRESLRNFLETLPRVGVGDYPHGVFVHLDVRDSSEAEHSRWTDYSERGERAR